jgi:hypothetical protein
MDGETRRNCRPTLEPLEDKCLLSSLAVAAVQVSPQAPSQVHTAGNTPQDGPHQPAFADGGLTQQQVHDGTSNPPSLGSGDRSQPDPSHPDHDLREYLRGDDGNPGADHSPRYFHSHTDDSYDGLDHESVASTGTTPAPRDPTPSPFEYSDAVRATEPPHHRILDSILETYLRENPGGPLILSDTPASPVSEARVADAASWPPQPERISEAAPGSAHDPPAVLPASVREAVGNLDVPGQDNPRTEQAEDACAAPPEQLAEREQIQASLLPGAPYAGMLPFDPEAVRQSVDTFFQHLSYIVREWPGGGAVLRFGPWLLAATALALECVRKRQRRVAAVLAPDWDGVPAPAALWAGEDE